MVQVNVASDASDADLLAVASIAQAAGVELTWQAAAAGHGVSLTVGARTLRGAAAATRWLALQAGDALGCDSLDVDEWLEWADSRLAAPAAKFCGRTVEHAALVAAAAAELPADGDEGAAAGGAAEPSDKTVAYAALLSAAGSIASHLAASGSPFLAGRDSASVADFVAAAPLLALPGWNVELLPESLAGLAAWFAALPVGDCSGGCEARAAAAAAAAAAESAFRPPTLAEVNALKSGSTLMYLRAICCYALHKAYPELAALGLHAAAVDKPAKAKFCHYQWNSAMSAFAKLKSSHDELRRPHDVAAKLVEALPENDVIASTAVNGPGFINIWLQPAFLSSRLSQWIAEGIPPPLQQPRTVALDMSSPNTAKSLHVGHLRSTILGETLARILTFCGHTVRKINHIGDWGTQFGMLIRYMKEQYPDFNDNPPDVENLTAFYKAAKARFDEDKDFVTRARQEVVALQSGEPGALAAWKTFTDISRRESSAIYDRLDVADLEELGESFYNDKLAAVVDDLDAAGISRDDKGARVCFTEGFAAPLFVRKSDGGFGYDSTDLAALRYRVDVMKASWLVYVVDGGQHEHFEKVFDVARRASWLPAKTPCEHVGFGLVLGEDGKRMKTRKGATVKLMMLLEEAKQNALRILNERRGEAGEEAKRGETHLTPEEYEAAAEAIGIGAVKYFDLRQHRMSNYKFDLERMLDLRGNTAVYLLLAYTRVRSIQAKARRADIDVDAINSNPAVLTVSHDSEIALAVRLNRFQDALEAVLDGLYPHHLCEHLYRTAVAFADFYRDCKVLGSEEQTSRLLLCEASAAMMKKGLELLGIRPLERI
eukprot:PLAT12749.2.p1 GENE.PLAT12749.2~~PLAT12749.2.p1  ORF type:complete len:829 (+),score=491.83 PLAT12749.2:12-2498(+)